MAEYLDDPEDGLPARVVHWWTRRKHHFLKKYLDIFARGMSRRWDRRAYVDLFAGPGRCCEEESGAFYNGSPLLAFDYPFTDHVYVELEERAQRALDERCDRYRDGRDVTVLQGNCNAEIRRVLPRLPSGGDGLTFAFIDPTSWQIRFSTVRALAEGRRVDLLITFMAPSMMRVQHLPEQPDVDAFFGTQAWRDDRFRGRHGRLTLPGLLACYREQLAGIGYDERPSTRSIPVTNTSGRVIYLLAFFSKHERGYDFWDKITAEDERGQRSFPWGDATH